MIVSETKYTQIFNAFWRQWREQDKLRTRGNAHYQFCHWDGVTLYGYESANKSSYIRVESGTQFLHGENYDYLKFSVYPHNENLPSTSKTYYLRIVEGE